MARESRSKKDKEMAARMKREGTRRTTGNCPFCHKPVTIGGRGLSAHLNRCYGSRGHK